MILSWVMWGGVIAGIFAFILAGASWVYQWKYAHFNTPVAPIRLVQIAACCVVIGASGGIADALLG